VALMLTACGGGSAPTIRPVKETKRNCSGAKVAARRVAQRERLDADLERLRRAAGTVHGHTQNGNRTLDAALDRFALDVANEALSAHERSGYINRAAAIVAPKCYLCFQALEANRPLASGAKLPCD
jgi:hypothetical protein